MLDNKYMGFFLFAPVLQCDKMCTTSLQLWSEPEGPGKKATEGNSEVNELKQLY